HPIDVNAAPRDPGPARVGAGPPGASAARLPAGRLQLVNRLLGSTATRRVEEIDLGDVVEALAGPRGARGEFLASLAPPEACLVGESFVVGFALRAELGHERLLGFLLHEGRLAEQG